MTVILTPRAHGIDISKYDLHFKPETATHQLDFVIQRASYGLNRDEAFDTLLPGVKQVPVRGAYHYLSSGVSWQTQADKFISYTSVADYHFFACDFEGAFNVLSLSFAKVAWDWIQYVKTKTGKPVVLYTSLALYNQYIGPSEATYSINWDTIPYWQAQWFLTPNPNGVPTMPSSRTGGWDLWQYTDQGNGPLFGVARPTACDLDVFDGPVSAMRSWLGLGTSVPVSEFVQLRVASSDVYLIRPDKFRKAFVTNTNGSLVKVSSIAQQFGAQIAINGDGWQLEGAKAVPLSLAASDGNKYQATQYDLRPFFDVASNNTVIVTHSASHSMYNTVSGTRYLVKLGQNAFATSADPEHITERHPRSAIGHTSSGKIILCVVDGRTAASQGVTLKELADIMIQAGAYAALELDGGGSSALWYKDKIVNVPIDQNIPGKERAVVNHFLLYTGEPMAKNKVTVTWNDGARERKTPSVNEPVVGTILPDNSIHYSDFDVVPDKDDPNSPDKKWIQLQSGWYIATRYPSSSGQVERAIVEPITAPAPAPTSTMVIEWDANDFPVSITVDGVKWVKP